MRPRLTTARPAHLRQLRPLQPVPSLDSAEDEIVDQLLGKYEPAEIAAKLNERLGLDRTACAIIQRMKRRGKSRWMLGYSVRDLERILGVDHRRIVRRWIEPGLLVAAAGPAAA